MILDERRISRSRFIRLGAILGVGSTGVSIAAACGVGGGSQNRQSPTTAGSVAVGPEVDVGEAIVAKSELARGSAFPLHQRRDRGAWGSGAHAGGRVRRVLGGLHAPAVHGRLPPGHAEVGLPVPWFGLRSRRRRQGRGRPRTAAVAEGTYRG
jgi:hypothetical protein